MISLLDLPAQHAPLHAALTAAMARVLAAGAFIQGPDVAAFAQELAAYLSPAAPDTLHVVPCANGTDALTLAFLALSLHPGDELIVPAFTYVATAEAAALLGLRVVLADVLPGTFTLDPAAVAAALTPRTKAIVPVHLFGQCAPMAELAALAQAHQLAVVEDAAQALGAEYDLGDGGGARPVPVAPGGVATMSFFPSKNLGALGDGGALLTRDAALATRLHEVANHGQPAGVKYRHERVGLNSRLDTLQAALLRVKLGALAGWTARRQAIAAHYDAAFADLPGLRPPAREPHSTHVFHQYVLTLSHPARREALRAYLAARQIPSAVYYPLPLHAQPAYRHLGRAGGFPVSEALCGTVLALPIHPTLSVAQVETIAAAVADFCAANPL